MIIFVGFIQLGENIFSIRIIIGYNIEFKVILISTVKSQNSTVKMAISNTTTPVNITNGMSSSVTSSSICSSTTGTKLNSEETYNLNNSLTIRDILSYIFLSIFFFSFFSYFLLSMM